MGGREGEVSSRGECDELRSLEDSLSCESIDDSLVVVEVSVECVVDDSIVAVVEGSVEGVVEGVVEGDAWVLFVDNSID